MYSKKKKLTRTHFSAGDTCSLFRQEKAIKPMVVLLRGIGTGVLRKKKNGLGKLDKTRERAGCKPYQAKGLTCVAGERQFTRYSVSSASIGISSSLDCS